MFDPTSRVSLTPPRVVLLIAGILCLGCGPGSLSQSPSAVCTESGTQCRLPDGPLGVCERSACPVGSEGPCFACTPQH